jgi:hypothetical protein
VRTGPAYSQDPPKLVLGFPNTLHYTIGPSIAAKFKIYTSTLAVDRGPIVMVQWQRQFRLVLRSRFNSRESITGRCLALRSRFNSRGLTARCLALRITLQWRGFCDSEMLALRSRYNGRDSMTARKLALRPPVHDKSLNGLALRL